MSETEVYTLKEKLNEIHTDLKDHREDYRKGIKDIDKRIDNLERHRDVTIRLARGGFWVIGVVIAAAFFFKDFLELF